MSARHDPEIVYDWALPGTSSAVKPPEPEIVVPRCAMVIVIIMFVVPTSPTQLSVVTSSSGSFVMQAERASAKARLHSRRVMIQRICQHWTLSGDPCLFQPDDAGRFLP